MVDLRLFIWDFPLVGDPRKLNFWHLLVERIRSRLSGWKSKNLSLGGWLILLKSVLSYIPVYFLSSSRLPKVSFLPLILFSVKKIKLGRG